jgi:hypothetical protein
LVGIKFVIKTDQMSLKHLVEQRVNHNMQRKGLCKLLGLNYIIEYKMGVENKVVDVLSRREENKSELLAIAELIPQWVNDVRENYLGDQWIEEMKRRIEKKGDREELYKEKDGLIRYKGRLCIGKKG